MDFIKQIHEARMTRGSTNQRELTYTDVCDRLYLSICILDLAYKYKSFAGEASRYVKRATDYSNYNVFRSSAPDLYNLIYFANGDKAAIDKLKDPGQAWKLRSNRNIPILKLNRYLTAISYGRELQASDKSILMELENTLGISDGNMRTVRRNIMNWHKQSLFDKRDTVTKLVVASRTKMPNSDLHPLLEKIVADKNLESETGADKPKVSVPDKPTNDNAVLYRYLLGKDANIALIRMFMDKVNRGETIPAHLVKAMAPAMQMLDEIVKAGPQYTNMVKIAHNRAKKQP